MKRLLSCIFMMVFFIGSQSLEAEESITNKYKITKQWETEKNFQVPESVLYDEVQNILFISNISGPPTEKNGQGFISKLSIHGKIETLKWVTGLNAPKGSAIHNKNLYVSDIDELVEIDLGTGKILARYPAPGAKFLNDVAIDSSGKVYVTDSSPENSTIYKLERGIMTVWLKGKEIDRPNGLYMENERVMVGNSGDGTLKGIHLADKKIQSIAKVGSGIDGLRSDGKGNYFISDWKGKTSLVGASGEVTEIINTTQDEIQSADLEYIEKEQLLIIPTFFDNRVMAYKVEKR